MRKSIRMTEEKQDKEGKKVTEKMVAVKRRDVLKSVVTADNIR